ncbi:MAG TPA: penicillin-binding protein activator LpoB [Gemmatimonadaceae bacterium]|nr:penicillin-binding protein activator LpoB [Gemmatimonadaceae bacterium]
MTRTRSIPTGRPLGLLLLIAASVALSACGIKRVSRVDPESVTDLSGRWNDTDSRLVANELINQSLGAPWARNWAMAHGGDAPTVIVGEFRNRTMEHIAVGTFVRDLERAYINSGTVRVVASAEERGEIRAEREDQQVNATAETRARHAREQGARFMLQGDVQAIEDSEGREKIVFYQIDATLIDLESNAKVWVGQHKIKKYVQRRRLTP